MSDPHEQIDAALLALRHMWSAPPAVHDETLGPVDSSSVQIVTVLAERPDAAAPVAQLAQALDVAPSTASRLVSRAEKAGLVERSAGPEDSRQVVVGLTTSGRTLARRSRRFRASYLAELTHDWTTGERRQFADLLQRFAQAATKRTPSRPSDLPTGRRAGGPQ